MSEPFTLFDGPATGKYMFNVGAPAQHFLRDAAELMAKGTQKRLQRELEPDLNGRLLQYGTQCGDPEFLQNLSDFLTDQYKDTVKKANLVQTAGATTALILLLNQMFERKVPVFCEHLSYFLGVQMLRQAGFTIRGVDTDSDGIDLEDLERQLKEVANEEDRRAGQYSSALYLVPTYQNPTGTVISDEKARQLVQLARRYNSLVFCDDVYNMLHYNGVVRKRLFAVDNPNDPDYGNGHVVSNGSFSKILAPGLRLGWMELPVPMRQRYYTKSPVLISSGSLNTYTGGIVSDLLKSGCIAEQLERIREEQGEKMKLLLEVLHFNLPEGCNVVHDAEGGYFVQVTLPTALPSTDIVGILKEKHDVLVHDGKKFIAEPNRQYKHPELSNSIRLCIAYLDKDAVHEGALLLCQELATQIDGN